MKSGTALASAALLSQIPMNLQTSCSKDSGLSFGFQMAVVNIGYKAADYFRKHPGCFISSHLVDWSPEKEETVPVGQGIVDWPDFFEAAKKGGGKNFYVEIAPEMFKESAEFLGAR